MLCILKAREGKLTGFQPQFRSGRRAKPVTLPVVAVVCLVLMALLAVVQVAHFHSTQAAADHCPLCVSIHSAVPVAATPAVIVLVQVGIPAPLFKARAATRNWHPKLFTRPPPTGC
jgi:hypothetical protein